MKQSIQPDRYLSLAAEYSTPYNAIVRDDVVMGVTRYFLERWLPLLGPGPAAIVNTLRQLDYHCHDNAIVIPGEALAREAGVSRRYLYTCLENPWMVAFIRQQSGERLRDEAGKVSQQPNQYHVRMDDPLTPADADHLRQILINLADTPLDAARRALDVPPESLWAPLPTVPAEQFTEPRPITAYDVLRRAFPTAAADPEAFAQAAEALHRHITLVRSDGRASKIIVPQYFRRRWWKRLGHDLAWSYLWLRSRVYVEEDGSARRDTCWIPCLNSILTIIGRNREWWRRNVESTPAQKDGWSLQDFFKQLDSLKGRDPKNPQWVARQFWVALDIPLAPEDRMTYSELVSKWPTVSSDPAEVRHNGAHRVDEGLPQINTPDNAGSATSVHTGSEGVRHIRAQGSATSVHRESESFIEALPEKKQASSTSSNSEPESNTTLASAAAAIDPESPPTKKPLIEILEENLRRDPQTPIFRAAPVQTWLEQVWPEPVRAHSPAWTMTVSGRVSPRDLVALILAVWVDSSIKHPPRYLSWLVQRWLTLPAVAPVENWEKWCALADMPIGDWFAEGRTQWIELAPRDNRALPFGLDALIDFDDKEESPLSPAPTVPEPPLAATGLDDHPGGGTMTARDIWTLTLNQLSVQFTRATYSNWLEGTKAVAYADGVLTVQARHGLARDWLAQRLNHSIEQAASSLARCPIKIQYVAPA